jgi:hypothetical protein
MMWMLRMTDITTRMAKLFYDGLPIISDLWGLVLRRKLNTSIREPKYDDQNVVYGS